MNLIQRLLGSRHARRDTERSVTCVLAALGLCLLCARGIRRALPHESREALRATATSADNVPLVASLERSDREAGGEVLHGETRFTLRDPVRSLLVTEDAQVDAGGRLVLAEVALEYGTLPAPDVVRRVAFDAANHRVHVIRSGGRSDSRFVDSSLPWIYVPVSLATGETLATPVAVSIARAAAQAGDFALRVSALGSDASLGTDQFAVSGTTEDWVVLGDDLATFARDRLGRAQLSTLHVAALDLDLRPQTLPQAARFCALDTC